MMTILIAVSILTAALLLACLIANGYANMCRALALAMVRRAAEIYLHADLVDERHAQVRERLECKWMRQRMPL